MTPAEAYAAAMRAPVRDLPAMYDRHNRSCRAALARKAADLFTRSASLPLIPAGQPETPGLADRSSVESVG